MCSMCSERTHLRLRPSSVAPATGWLIVVLVITACTQVGPISPGTSPVAPSSTMTITLAQSESASVGPGWGPLAVVPPQEGADTARNEGTLRITETCVVLVTSGGPVLLVWPADRTTWNGDARSIAFANDDGSTVTATDGASVVVGGSGDSSVENGLTTEIWLAQTPWVERPAVQCPLDARWWVGALTN
jgi:hypothetical protein